MKCKEVGSGQLGRGWGVSPMKSVVVSLLEGWRSLGARRKGGKQVRALVGAWPRLSKSWGAMPRNLDFNLGAQWDCGFHFHCTSIYFNVVKSSPA